MSDDDGIRTVLLDVDGTLVDTNWLHVIAWQRAFRHVAGRVLPAWRLHHEVGKGGDQFVPSVAGAEFEQRHGDEVRAGHEAAYGELIGEVRPLPGARELLVALKERGFRTALASSGKASEIDHYLDLLDARELLDGWTTSDDVESTKPEPHLLRVALERAGGGPALLVGDSLWDCEAAKRAGIPVIALLAGGFCPEELRAAGARTTYDSPAELCGDLDAAGLAGPSRR
jgi:HAD superfamily hydrolase (TIGR01509 family)